MKEITIEYLVGAVLVISGGRWRVLRRIGRTLHVLSLDGTGARAVLDLDLTREAIAQSLIEVE